MKDPYKKILASNGMPFNQKEQKELKKQQSEMKAAAFKFHVQAFSQACDDNKFRMMFRVINEKVDSQKQTVLFEFGYDKDQLAIFIHEMREHEKDMKTMQKHKEDADN